MPGAFYWVCLVPLRGMYRWSGIMHEILWHGRGGQGVVLASEVLAEAAYLQGYRGVTSAPTFGPERRGAPLTASTRIDDEPIRTFSQIALADIVIVLDELLFGSVDIGAGLRNGGILIVNSARPPENFRLPDKPAARTASVDAAAIAREFRLTVGGAPVVNTPLLGSLARLWDRISLAGIERGLAFKMPPASAYNNYQAVRRAFEMTVVGDTRHEQT